MVVYEDLVQKMVEPPKIDAEKFLGVSERYDSAIDQINSIPLVDSCSW